MNDFHPLDHPGMKPEEMVRDWRSLNPIPYDKMSADPYTKTRVILMNGIKVRL